MEKIINWFKNLDLTTLITVITTVWNSIKSIKDVFKNKEPTEKVIIKENTNVSDKK